jgi:2-polyprenyl-6-methoxyphenol hydroxylase-like FAD-dependent oxidoreductase
VASGQARSVRARYLVAGDGAHSMVRKQLGIAMRGPDNLAESFSVLFRAPLWDVLGSCRHGIYDIKHPDALGVFLPAGRGDRWLFGMRSEPGAGAAAARGEERLIELIRIASGIPGLQPKIERTGSFSFAAQLADEFRSGSAFLAGDAAHRVTPRGGTGMNIAIQDGFDLGWKLAWVLRGWAGDDLLDSYERERRPVVEHNLARSLDPAGSIREIGTELQADLGPRIAHVWVPVPEGRVSTVDLVGPGLTLFTGPRGDVWRRAADAVTGLVPFALRSLDAIAARALGVRDGGALLVRPDGAATGWWPHAVDPVAALQAAVRPFRTRARILQSA